MLRELVSFVPVCKRYSRCFDMQTLKKFTASSFECVHSSALVANSCVLVIVPTSPCTVHERELYPIYRSFLFPRIFSLWDNCIPDTN